MRKFQYFVLLGLMMTLAACSKDETTAPDTGMIAQSITVTVPQNGMQTRATAADFGNGANIDRCILAIYRNGQLYGEQQFATVQGGRATFNLRLVASQTYDFVFWADCSDNGADNHYNTADLQNITVKGDYTGNNDEFDAFFGVELGKTVTENFSLDKTLKRPFGQLNVRTNDLASIPDATLRPTDVKVTFSALPVSFNAMTGAVGEETAEVSYTAQVINADGELSMDYIWAPTDEATLAQFSMEYINNGTTITTNNAFTNIPIRRNYKTNVSGNLLTKQGTINVTIDPIWEGTVSSVRNGSTGATFATMQDAVVAAASGDELFVSGTFDEDVAINKNITIKGVDGQTKISTLELAGGIDVTCENIEFFGSKGFYNGPQYGVMMNDVKEATFKNCRFAVSDPQNMSALTTIYNVRGKLTFDGCNFDAQPQFQQLAEGGSLTILNSDFTEWGAIIEPGNYPNHTIEGNTFKTVYFSATSGANEAAALSGAERALVNEVLAGNTFVNEEQKVKIWGNPAFYVNDPVAVAHNVNSGKYYATVKEAVAAAAAGDRIQLTAGDHHISYDVEATDKRYLRIDKPLTLEGLGEGATLYSNDEADASYGGTLGGQDFIMVEANNVTLKNLKIYSNYNLYFEGNNKLIEVIEGFGNFTMENCSCHPHREGKTPNNAGSIYIGGENPGLQTSATIKDCTFDHAGISVRGNATAVINGSSFDGIRELEGWNCAISVRGRLTGDGLSFSNPKEGDGNETINTRDTEGASIELTNVTGDYTVFKNTDENTSITINGTAY